MRSSEIVKTTESVLNVPQTHCENNRRKCSNVKYDSVKSVQNEQQKIIKTVKT
jgi:hypothetical protein